MKILKLDNNSKKNLLEDLLKRSPNNYGQYAGVVDEVLNNVKNNGDKALFEYTKKFDKATITSENIRVTQEEIEEAERARQEMAEREALTHQPVDENTEQAQSEDYSDRHIGRNEPCPCGSGKKYKHCHGSKARYA